LTLQTHRRRRDVQEKQYHLHQRTRGPRRSPAGGTEGSLDRARRTWAASGAWRRALRHRIYEVLEAGHAEARAGRLFDLLLVTLILMNVAAFVAETVPRLAEAYGAWFNAFEVGSVAIFTVEYVLRLWTAIEVPFLARLPAWKARLRFACRPALVIDLMAILPFYLSFLVGIDLRILRVLRLLRFLKLSRYSPAMHSLVRVVSSEGRALTGAALLLVTAVLFASSGIYFIEGSAQPEHFGSVPASAWWAIATLTTVGYGDIVPVTPLGRAFGAIVMVTGLCILALPVAIISSGFAQEVSRRNFVITWSLMSRIPMLAELEASEVGAIMPLLHAHNLPPNVEVMGEGGEGHAMYFIASGKVRMRGASGERTFMAGDVFGVVAMLAGDREPGSFVTASKCRLLKLHREDFHRLELANPKIAESLRAMAARSRVASPAPADPSHG
jgi:voltage-gated potassium channel